MLSDENLLSEINNGNEAALEVLVKRHYNTVFSYICRRTGDYHKSYDLSQEVFIKMMASLGKTRIEDGKFVNWLLKIAVNTCRDYYRSSGFKQMGKTEELLENTVTAPNVISLIERKEEITALKEALASLPEEQREAVILKYYHEKKFIEIAQITGINESTAKSRVRQALIKLSKKLGREVEDCEGRKETGRFLSK